MDFNVGVKWLKYGDFPAKIGPIISGIQNHQGMDIYQTPTICDIYKYYSNLLSQLEIFEQDFLISSIVGCWFKGICSHPFATAAIGPNVRRTEAH